MKFQGPVLAAILGGLLVGAAHAGAPGVSIQLTHAPEPCPVEKIQEKRCILTEVVEFWRELRASLAPICPLKDSEAERGDPIEIATAHIRTRYPSDRFDLEVTRAGEIDSALCEFPAKEVEMTVRRAGTSWLTRERVVVADKDGHWQVFAD